MALTTLLFLRHGQASFGAANYDVLSEKGGVQAAHFGRYLVEVDRSVTRVVSGRLQRQRDTAKHLAAAANADGVTLPSTETIPEFDEYPAFEIIDHLIRAHVEDADVVQFLHGEDRVKERAIHRIMRRWSEGSLDVGSLETFQDFSARVNRGIDALLKTSADDATVLVVTSGGPVAVAMRRCLDLTPKRTLDLAWSIWNASFTEMRIKHEELRLIRFNAVPHLERHQLLSHR